MGDFLRFLLVGAPDGGSPDSGGNNQNTDSHDTGYGSGLKTFVQCHGHASFQRIAHGVVNTGTGQQREVTPRVDVVQGDVCTRVLELALFSGGKECLFPKG